MNSSVDALLFDLGRVIIDLDVGRVHARWADLAGVSVDQIDQRYASGVADSEAFHQHERGEITDAEFFDHIRQAFQIDLTDAQFTVGWNAMFVKEMPGIRRVLSRMQHHLPLYIFSNTNAAHQAHWSAHFADVLAPFRKIYVSNEIGARKPEQQAFQAVVADMGFAPERILFLDDLAGNVEGAQSCGLLAAQVATTAEIQQVLDGMKLGVR